MTGDDYRAISWELGRRIAYAMMERGHAAAVEVECLTSIRDAALQCYRRAYPYR